MSEMPGISRLVERADWEALGLCLALGVLREAARHSPEALEMLIDELAGELGPQRRQPHRVRRVKGRGTGRGRR
jgi:hypothetical protein